MHSWVFDAIGTRWRLDAGTDIDRSAVLSLVEGFDRIWSRFRGDSEVTRLRTTGHVDLGEHAPEIFALYDRLHRLTDGAMSPAIGASLERLGYDADYTLTAHGEAVAAFRWTDARREGSTIEVDQPVVVDIGAVGKGYLADRVADLVGEPVTVDASGDIVHRGPQPLRVAMEHPADPSKAVGVIEVPPGHAVAASAANRRIWGEGLHHILDARTGRPASDIVATWAVAPSAALADGLATALFFVSPERVLDEFPGVGCAVIDRSLRIRAIGLPGEVFR
ncbi:hypothetical protein BHE97_17970 [Aeromicrobium sp. PE09-221]|uniref:FAD:protein FMN transferase n=1 Tax=Aeromicrobium sp. PE09-221 TaxID=1898043 RepID=UPI000B3ED4C4|nr:FAD:protein FMN transferase [Aeromicrobium sp. PE09-221]OUZ07061.1 hypothetical protein BHE97_17970 [Aeromicrobium sp. PE09-221]